MHWLQNSHDSENRNTDQNARHPGFYQFKEDGLDEDKLGFHAHPQAQERARHHSPAAEFYLRTRNLSVGQ